MKNIFSHNLTCIANSLFIFFPVRNELSTNHVHYRFHVSNNIGNYKKIISHDESKFPVDSHFFPQCRSCPRRRNPSGEEDPVCCGKKIDWGLSAFGEVASSLWGNKYRQFSPRDLGLSVFGGGVSPAQKRPRQKVAYRLEGARYQRFVPFFGGAVHRGLPSSSSTFMTKIDDHNRSDRYGRS